MDWKGRVLAITVSAEAGGPTTSPTEVQAVEGRGLDSDRYFLQAGSFSKSPKPHQQVTLIESEALEAVKRDYGI